MKVSPFYADRPPPIKPAHPLVCLLAISAALVVLWWSLLYAIVGWPY